MWRVPGYPRIGDRDTGTWGSRKWSVVAARGFASRLVVWSGSRPCDRSGTLERASVGSSCWARYGFTRAHALFVTLSVLCTPLLVLSCSRNTHNPPPSSSYASLAFLTSRLVSILFFFHYVSPPSNCTRYLPPCFKLQDVQIHPRRLIPVYIL